MHKGIDSLLYSQVGDLPVSALPEGLFAVRNTDAFKRQMIHFAERFGGIDKTIGETEITAIPNRCPIRLCEMAITTNDILALPKGILALEVAVDGFYPSRFLESRFAFADGHALQTQVAALIQRPLAFEILIGYRVHLSKSNETTMLI